MHDSQTADGGRTRWAAVFAILLGSLLVARPAQAQPAPPAQQQLPPVWSGTPLPAPNGVKLGEGRLHPQLGLESRLDSAAGYFSAPGALPALRPELVWFLRPGVRYELTGRELEVRASGELEYVWYSQWLTPGSGQASRLQGHATVAANINPGGSLEVRLSDTVSRDDRVSSVAVGYGLMSLGNRLQVAVPVRPGAGALEVTPRATYAVELFSPLVASSLGACDSLVCDPEQTSTLGYQSLQLGTEGRWRFLPRTAAVVDLEFEQRGFMAGVTPAISMLRGTAGLSGLLTARVAVNLRAGWAQDLGTSRFGTALVQADVTAPVGPAQLRGGYQRAVDAVGLVGLFSTDRLFTEARAQLGPRLQVVANGGLDFVRYHGAAASQRADTLVRLDLAPTYHLSPWLQLGAGYLLGLRTSSIPRPGTGPDLLNFTRQEGYVRVTATY